MQAGQRRLHLASDAIRASTETRPTFNAGNRARSNATLADETAGRLGPQPIGPQPTEVMNFEDGEEITVETYELDAGAQPYNRLQDYWNAVADMIDVMGTHHLTGIANFIDTMQFEGSQRAQADILGAIFGGVGKDLLNAALNGITGLVPIPGFSVVGLVKIAIEDATTEVERAARAGAEANLAAWARDHRSAKTTVYTTARMAFRNKAEVELPTAFEATS